MLILTCLEHHLPGFLFYALLVHQVMASAPIDTFQAVEFRRWIKANLQHVLQYDAIDPGNR